MSEIQVMIGNFGGLCLLISILTIIIGLFVFVMCEEFNLLSMFFITASFFLFLFYTATLNWQIGILEKIEKESSNICSKEDKQNGIYDLLRDKALS
jgi:hypothetical protein